MLVSGQLVHAGGPLLRFVLGPWSARRPVGGPLGGADRPGPFPQPVVDHRDHGGTDQTWNQAIEIARAERTAQHPNLIDLDDGTEYEWTGEDDLYTHVEDHDAAWPRADLFCSNTRLATGSIPPGWPNFGSATPPATDRR